METERDRLGRLYAELGDEHLRDLADDADDLTDEGRVALAAELKKRGFDSQAGPGPVVQAGEEEERAYGFGAGIPGVVPAAGAAVEEALEASGETRQGMMSLASFYDGLELSRACAALEEADVEPAIEEIEGDAAVGTTTRFEIWVEAPDYEAGRAALHAKLGLFPVGEEHGDADEEVEAADRVVGQFESAAEAEEVRAMLAAEGFGARVEGDKLSASTSVVVVPAGQAERALEVLQEKLEVE